MDIDGNVKSDSAPVLICDSLPDDILEKTIGFANRQVGKPGSSSGYLESRLPRSDIGEIEKVIKKYFPISKERLLVKKRFRRKGCQKQQYLTGTKKRKLGLYNISRTGLKFKDVLPIHVLWCSYMDEYLGLKNMRKNKGVDYCNKEEFHQQLCKADYHGAYLIVTRSLCPSLVGIEGIVVFETKNCFKLVSKDDITRSVSKEVCEFQLKIDDFEIKFLGKNFLIRPSERSKRVKMPVCQEL